MSYESERDIEIPRLIDFLDRHSGKIETILDVGCSGSKYLNELNKYAKVVDGVDVHFRADTAELLNNYFVGNAIDYPLGKYDLVLCISTLEHAGVSPYKVDDYEKEQFNLFRKIVDISIKFLFVTFPYGMPALPVDNLANISKKRLDVFLALLGDAQCQLRFYFNENVYDDQGWKEIDQDIADKVPYLPEKGVRCICILEAEK